MLIVSLALAFAPLLGIAYIFSQGLNLTVDNLFYTIILLTISGVFGLNVMLELRRGRTAAGQPGLRFAVGSAGVRTERGLVEAVQFFESHVGQADKSIVSLRPNGSRSVRMIAFEGDLRNQMPTGHKVEVTYNSDGGGTNQVVSVNYK